jgi:hypothetical protein
LSGTSTPPAICSPIAAKIQPLPFGAQIAGAQARGHEGARRAQSLLRELVEREAVAALLERRAPREALGRVEDQARDRAELGRADPGRHL